MAKKLAPGKRRCPFCNKIIAIGFRTCPHCGEQVRGRDTNSDPTPETTETPAATTANATTTTTAKTAAPATKKVALSSIKPEAIEAAVDLIRACNNDAEQAMETFYQVVPIYQALMKNS